MTTAFSDVGIQRDRATLNHRFRDLVATLCNLDQTVIHAIHEHLQRSRRVLDEASTVEPLAVIFERGDADYIHLVACVTAGQRQVVVELNHVVVLDEWSRAKPEVFISDEARRLSLLTSSHFQLSNDAFDDALAFVASCDTGEAAMSNANLRVAYYFQQSPLSDETVVEVSVVGPRFAHRKRIS